MTSEVWYVASIIFGSFAFVNFLMLLWLAIHSRNWSTPIQAALLMELRKELDIVRGNLGRVTGEYRQSQHETMEADNRIWEELRRINERLDSMRCPLNEPQCPLKIVLQKE